MRVAVRQNGSNWKSLASWNEFAEAVEAACGTRVPAKQKRPKDVLALTLPSVQQALSRDNVFTMGDFLTFVCRVSCMKRGVCNL